MIFLIGGYNEKESYGRIFQLAIPTMPDPVEQNIKQFGMVWGGQKEFTQRLIHGFDPKLPSILQRKFNLSDDKKNDLVKELQSNLSIPIPYQFLPLQDCVDLSIYIIKTTIELQKFFVGIRGVGGDIDVATITKTDGFKAIQQKTILGENKR